MRQFWHIQLHPGEKLKTGVLRRILSEKELIGVNDYWELKNGQPAKDPELFKNEMQIGDVVLVRDGAKPIALTEVTGEAVLIQNPNKELDWFPLRRSIRVLGYFSIEDEKILQEALHQFGTQRIQALGTLTLCRKPTATKFFIEHWFQKIEPTV